MLLATPASPDASGIGSLFLRDLIASRPDLKVLVCEVPPFLLGSNRVAPSKLKRLLRAASTRIPRFQTLRLRWFRLFHLEARAKAVAEFATAEGLDRIWATASSVEMIWIAQLLAARGFDLRVTVWDAPEYLCGNLGLTLALQEDVLSSFADVMGHAKVVSVIGHAMQKDYQRRFGIKSEIIRHGIRAQLRPVALAPRPDTTLRIVFAGSLYSKQEWNSFVEALDSAGWQINGRPVSLSFIGRFPLSGARKPRQINLLGEKSFEETLDLLSGMDIGYLPYWFDAAHEIVARTSFPGKLSAYAAAGLAVFHHAPAYTEAAAFLQAYPFGVTCPSLDPAEIVAALTQFSEIALTESVSAARELAYREELSQAAMAVRFGRFLGVHDA